ncbi:ATP-binding protein [Bifidobacterium phasiani]|uniref:DNA binding domain-containing protein n=1 Tax=Bifidobacterium phasiani TaxID=2834431 RepID=A0ABS6WAL9_9BIFI|nr:putative DNA binding domain-containing protein [Bifidobacterium phasiani]
MDNDDYTAKMTELIELMRIIGNDTQQCEVKECKRRISTTITETLSAFSNGNGGYIILGLSEKAGFTPVEGFDARSMQEALSQACEKLTPVVRPVIVTCPFEGANLVFAVIDEMLPREKPCYVTASGPHGGSYIRTGDGDRKMTEYEVDRLLEEQRQPEHDIAVVPEATLDDLNPTLVRALLDRERERHPHVFANRSDDDMMLDLRILRERPQDDDADAAVPELPGHADARTIPGADPGCHGHADVPTVSGDGAGSVRGSGRSRPAVPTLAGLLAVGRYPQKFFPRLNVTIAVYPGTSRDEVFTGGARLVTSETVTGPIPVMIDDAVTSLMDWTASPTDAEFGTHPTQPPMYPRLVLREAIANALTHRDYSPDALGTPVHVDVFTDRIEVSNPGGLFGAVSKRRLTHEASTSARNAFLFSLLRSTPYPDGGTVLRDDGTGYLQIGAALRSEAREPVRIENELDRFRVIIPGRVTDAAMTERNFAQRILQLLEREPSASVRDIIRELGLSPIAVAAGLRSLMNKGLVESGDAVPTPHKYYRLRTRDARARR